ncbi:hypothetical protein K438DRAFT_1783849 [Mycena galopus ATCC 62051]|nr:hypothetical protein K438DRAFT_1783849 [Mycena galopus ATCC 62051]
MPSLHVPLEICSIICTQVDDPSTLAALCRTSRSFRDEAQRILYHTIDLGGHPIRHVKSWARAITRNAHLAGRVHALSLQLPQARKLAESDSEDVSKIQRALHSCINLKELKFTGVNLEALRRPKHAYVWILDDAPFWLTKFDNSYFATGALKRFWPAQSDIRVLSLPHSIDAPTVFADGQLPNLIALRVPQWPVLPQGRPLQRLETGFTNDFSPLAHYSGTLTTLNLVCEWYYPGLLGPITNIPTLLPALLHFGIAECVKLLPMCLSWNAFRRPHLQDF